MHSLSSDLRRLVHAYQGSSVNAHVLVMIAIASALLVPGRAIAQSAPNSLLLPILCGHHLNWCQYPTNWSILERHQLLLLFHRQKRSESRICRLHIETTSKPKGGQRKSGTPVEIQKHTDCGDVVEKWAFERGCRTNWKYYEAQANLIGPSETTSNGEEETGSPGHCSYTLCKAELLDNQTSVK